MSGSEEASRRRRLAVALLVELVNEADDQRVEDILATALHARGNGQAESRMGETDRLAAPIYPGAWRPGVGRGNAPDYENVSMDGIEQPLDTSP